MDTKKIKEYCKNIIALCEDLDSTDDKAKVNDILMDLDLNKEELLKELAN